MFAEYYSGKRLAFSIGVFSFSGHRIKVCLLSVGGCYWVAKVIRVPGVASSCLLVLQKISIPLGSIFCKKLAPLQHTYLFMPPKQQ